VNRVDENDTVMRLFATMSVTDYIGYPGDAFC